MEQITAIVEYIGYFYLFKFIVLTVLYNILNGIRIHIWSRVYPFDFKKKFGKWAVVTGCTDGIGLAYVRELARRGMNVVLISRSKDKLEAAARDIERDFQVETLIVQADFSKESRDLYPRIANHLKHLDVGILVNNVGVLVPYPMYTAEMSEEQIWDHLMVNVAAATLMSSLVLSNMKAKKRGAIVNVSTGLSIAPIPSFGIYCATKIYIDHLSYILQLECEGSGVSVQLLKPGYVITKMVGYSSTLMAGGFTVPPAERYARHAVATIGCTSCTTGYFVHGIQMWFAHVAPVCVVTAVMRILNKKFRKEYNILQSAKAKMSD